MKRTKFRMSAALVAVALVSMLAMAAATGTEAIKQRHEAMEAIGKAMSNFGAIAKKQAPFDPTVVQSSAKTIAEQLEKAAGLFPEGSETGDHKTEARAEIWSDRENFDKAFKSAHAAAVAMQQVKEEADFMPALGALGNGCKTCHDKYRLAD